MMPVVDKPVLQYIVEECAAAGLTDILIVGRPDKPEIKRHFSKDENLLAFLEKNGKYDLEKTVSDICGEAEITVIDQLDAGGSGAAVMLAKDFAGGEPFAILNGDDLYYSLSKRPAIGQVADCYLKFGRTSLGVLEVAREDVSKYCSLKLDGEKDGYFVCSDVVENPRQKRPLRPLRRLADTSWTKTSFPTSKERRNPKTERCSSPTLSDFRQEKKRFTHVR